MQGKGFFARMADLWRGFWGITVSNAEARNAEAVYHNAITQRAQQLNRLKQAVGRLVFLRNRVEQEQQKALEDRRLVEASLERAVHNSEDAKALALIRKKKSLVEEVERCNNEYIRLDTQVENSKEGLRELAKAIGQLKSECTEMLARKANAEARLEINTALQKSRGNFAHLDSGLESVRESIMRLETAADLDDVSTQDENFEESGEVSLAQLRRQSADDDALAELEALRNARPHLLTKGASVQTSTNRVDEFVGSVGSLVNA